MQRKRITIKDMFWALSKRELYLDLLIMLFVCVPAVLGLLFFSLKVDKKLNWSPFIGFPLDIILFFLFFSTGVIIVWRAYTYLVIIGQGGPCPQLGGTHKLVTTGPYSWVRHPSVIGKLLGMIGLGFLSGSVFFTLFVIPTLFIWSAFYNRFIQEKGCIEKFGEEYIKYRKQVPMFIPSFRRVLIKKG